MDDRAEVREFVATRRAKIGPEQAGVPLYGTRLRVRACVGRRSPSSPG